MFDKIKSFYNNCYDYQKDLEIDWQRMNRWLRGIEDHDWFEYNSCMLDVGCGTGRSRFWALRHKILWTGIDNSERAVEIARLNLGVGLVDCMDAERMTWPNDFFDFVVALGSIEHMNDPAAALREMHRILRVGGLAVILVPNRITLLEYLGLYHGTEQPQELMLSKQEWKDMILDAGFVISYTRKDYGPPVFKNWKPHKIAQRALLKLSYILPDSFAYAWIFDCAKEV